jgi:predicted transposase YdaD
LYIYHYENFSFLSSFLPVFFIIRSSSLYVWLVLYVVLFTHVPYNLFMGSNIKYKDSVFSFLFSSPDILRELYCAIENVTLPNDVPITINTLQDVLFMDRVNDISFEIGGKLVVLIEHQSSINPNMALRLLMYVGRVYEKIVTSREMYSTKRVTFPRPEFYVLYNGTAEYPDEAEMRLTESYESTEGLGIREEEEAALELKVKVININHGRNGEIQKRSRTLEGYSIFVERVRAEVSGGKGKEAGMKAAVEYCLEAGILKDFFVEHGTEVINMLMSEWKIEDARQVWLEEGVELGLVRGREEGLEQGLEQGREEGLEQGREEGLEQGREEGLEQGLEAAARNALAKGIPVELICEITGFDVEALERLASG